jgi:poly(3-hydroxybutyrate) depolymerase
MSHKSRELRAATASCPRSMFCRWRVPGRPRAVLGSFLSFTMCVTTACVSGRSTHNPIAAGSSAGSGGTGIAAVAGQNSGGTTGLAGMGGQGGTEPPMAGTPSKPALDAAMAGAPAADAGVSTPTDASAPRSDAGQVDMTVDAAQPTTKCDKIPPPSEDCGAPLAPGDKRKCTMTVAGNSRYYYLYAPKNYNPCEPTALVIDCHGAMEPAEIQAGIDHDHMAGGLDYPGIGSGWQLEAETEGGGFLVATPAGINEVWTTRNSDPEFFIQILEATKKSANIDPAKVYMTGISNGSIISFATVCKHSDLFSGIAAFSAGQTCSSIGRPVPVISFDAKPDFAYTTTVNATNAMVELNGCSSTPDADWLVIDPSTTDPVCRDEPYSTDPKLVPCNTITKTSLTTNGIAPTVCKRWDGCDDGVAVVFCDVAPSTRHGASNASVDAHILYSNASSLNMPSVAWRFFKSFWK